jgi:hypothetical protein
MPGIGVAGMITLPQLTPPVPTPYRYTVLVERAKQLISIAQQIETSFLSALEKRDAEYYTLLKARQDVRLTQAGVRLQQLRVTEAQSGVKLAELQKDRAQLEVDHFQKLLDEGLSGFETASLSLLIAVSDLQMVAAIINFVAAALPSSAGSTGVAWSPQGSMGSVAAGISSIAGSLATSASILSTLASYERRAEEWDYQKSLGKEDVLISGEQLKIAQDHVRVVGQEQKIAELQAEHAQAIADFLGTKFTSYELYDWMSGVLERVYSSFLQWATVTAQLALNQLGFERQQTPPPYIQSDYWQSPSEDGRSSDAKSPERRGLTGSARLLQDLYQLDQYRFETDQRKQQLSKVISVARVAPDALVSFQETGVMKFATPIGLFDRDYPGDYVRLVKRVRVSVIGLIPPNSGIRATLTTSRTSRVVVGGTAFQTVHVQHGPDRVQLSSPREASGVFELDAQSEMLHPFEGIGVDTMWEFRMPKASNFLDYRTIADVLLLLDYTALHDADLETQVVQTIDSSVSAARPFSFRQQFSDAWYDLHNPDQTATPMQVRFATRLADFPPNLDDLRIRQLTMYFIRAEGFSFELQNVGLRFKPAGALAAIGGLASSKDAIISTRTGSADSWIPVIGKKPVGTWELALSNDADTRKVFADDGLEDILLVVTYDATTPPWPK